MTDLYLRYRRKQIAELADWTPGFDMSGVSVSEVDKQAGSPKAGDKIARNPANHADRWLVAADYFAANFEPVDGAPPTPAMQPVAWLHEFTDQHDGTRRRAAWMHPPKEYDLMSGDTVTPLYTAHGAPAAPALRQMTRDEVQALARKVGVHDPVTFDAMTRLVNAALAEQMRGKAAKQ